MPIKYFFLNKNGHFGPKTERYAFWTIMLKTYTHIYNVTNCVTLLIKHADTEGETLRLSRKCDYFAQKS